MDKLDVILLMSVNPGSGGQSFIPGTLAKLRQVRRLIDESGRDIRLEIDGGVRSRTSARSRPPVRTCSWPAPPSSASRTLQGGDRRDAGGAGPCPLSVPSIWCCSISMAPDRQLPQLALAVNRTLADLGLAEADEAVVRTWVGNGADKLIQRALDYRERRPSCSPGPALFDRHYQACLLEGLGMYEGSSRACVACNGSAIARPW